MCKRILYVEDNPRNMLLVRRILEAEGHELLEAVDGEAGWENGRFPQTQTSFSWTYAYPAN